MMTLARPTILDLLHLCHNARPDEIVQYEALTGNEWTTAFVANEIYNQPGLKFVVLRDDVPIVAGGYRPLIAGVWDSWMVGTMADWETHWRSITKFSRKVMELMFEENGARRLQTCALASRTKTCEWYVRALKMQQEGILRGFGVGGEDVAMFSRIR